MPNGDLNAKAQEFLRQQKAKQFLATRGTVSRALAQAKTIGPPETTGHQLARWGVGALPAAGMTVGGVAGAAGGPLGAVGGAALGGGAGEAARQLVSRATGIGEAPKTSGEAAKGIAGQAAVGAGTEVLGQTAMSIGARVANRLVKSALRILDIDVEHGASPIQALLTRTTGRKPFEIAKQAEAQASSEVKELEGAAAKATGTPDMTPMYAELKRWKARAAKQGVKEVYDEIEKLGEVLREGRAGPIPKPVKSAGMLLERKRGIDTLINGWEDKVKQSSLAQGAAKTIRNMLNDELERLVPEAKELNPSIHTMLTLERLSRAAAKRQPPPVFSGWMLWRAMTAAGLGYAGYRHGGPEEAALMIGATMGLTFALRTPGGKIAMARTAKTLTPKAVQAIVAAARLGESEASAAQ